jgi:hypothetical protein
MALNVNMDGVWSIVKTMLIASGGGLVSNGLATADQVNAWAGAVVILLSGAWALWGHFKAQKLAAAAAIPEVKQIVVDTQKTADAQGPKVVTPSDIRAGK